MTVLQTYTNNLKHVKKIMKNSTTTGQDELNRVCAKVLPNGKYKGAYLGPSAVYEINSLLYIKFRLERGAWKPLGGCLSHRQSPCGLRFVRAKG